MNRQWKKVAGLIMAALMVGATIPAAVAGNGHGRSLGKLEGAWKVTVTTYNCQTKQAAPPFVSLLSFTASGTMTETTANPGFQPGQRSIGLGTWMRTGSNSYWSTTRAFIQFDSPAPPPLLQFSRGEQRIDQGIKMTGRDSWTSEAITTLTRADGTDYFSSCARAVATRLE